MKCPVCNEEIIMCVSMVHKGVRVCGILCARKVNNLVVEIKTPPSE